jgi:hypothetical protein
MMQRFLFEKSKEGHFIGIRDKEPDAQHGLAGIGTWTKGSQTISHRFSVASLSLS